MAEFFDNNQLGTQSYLLRIATTKVKAHKRTLPLRPVKGKRLRATARQVMWQREALHNPPFRAEMRERIPLKRGDHKSPRIDWKPACQTPPTHAGARNNFAYNKVPS